VNKVYRYRLYPDKEQKILITKTFGCVRFIYNKMLAERKMTYELYSDDEEALKRQKYSLPADYMKEHEWLREVDSLALANAQMNLDAAYRNFHRNPSNGYPKFKSRTLQTGNC
jgi:putative transposase